MRKTGMVITLVAAIALVAAPVSATAARVTSGRFATFADGAGLGYAVAGHAVMTRTSHTTKVSLAVSGLEPGSTYGSHVHNQSCDSGNAGGHYSFGYPVPGGALDGSEIWPGPITANAAGRAVGWVRVDDVAGPEAVSVVIHAPGGAKIACADLG
ncbi:MAG TPA: hypothetical protein VEB69_12755 [Acidimicrobiia bacterium]|nr:hypothetical protein [Acidimicrobiia bacterium]